MYYLLLSMIHQENLTDGTKKLQIVHVSGFTDLATNSNTQAKISIQNSFINRTCRSTFHTDIIVPLSRISCEYFTFNPLRIAVFLQFSIVAPGSGDPGPAQSREWVWDFGYSSWSLDIEKLGSES